MAARRQLPLDGRLPAIEDATADSKTPHSSSSGIPLEASSSKAGGRSALKSNDGSAAATTMEGVRSDATLMPLPDDDLQSSHGKLPAVAAPARIEIQARAGGPWQTSHSEALGASSSSSACHSGASSHAAGPADSTAAIVVRGSSVATALPGSGSPEPCSSSWEDQAVVRSDMTEPPTRGPVAVQPRQGPLARAVSLRETYGGTPLAQQAAAADEPQSSSPQRRLASVRTAFTTFGPPFSDSVASMPGEMRDVCHCPAHISACSVAWLARERKLCTAVFVLK